ncbi:MAG: histidine phosphatase family protein [Nitrospiraceae bacterium]|nr:MAG: histidine phosphatase family protein [Nitrospiraceae bacterium]
MVTTIYLIRHGETEGSEAKRYKGSIDVPLSENGQRQIEQVAEYLNKSYRTYKTNNDKLKAVYCSPLSRALKSAEIIAEPHGLKPIVIENLRERSFGIWEGMTFTEIKEKYPQEFEAWANNPLKYSPMGGESTIEVRERAISALNKIMDNHNCNRIQDAGYRMQDKKNHESCIMNLASSSSIAVVAHGGVNRIMLCHIMGIPLENIFRIEQDFAAVNIIEFWEKYPVVKLLNGAAIG